MDPIQPQMPGAAPKRSIAPVISIVVVIVLIVIAVLYFWGEKISNRNDASAVAPAQNETMVTTNEAAPQASTSDEVNALEAELQNSGSTDVDLTGLENM